jgi:hypothetical protein
MDAYGQRGRPKTFSVCYDANYGHICPVIASSVQLDETVSCYFRVTRCYIRYGRRFILCPYARKRAILLLPGALRETCIETRNVVS